MAYDYGTSLLASVPKGATLFASGDNSMFSLAYLHLTEGRRPDLTIYDDSGYIFPNIYGVDFVMRPSDQQEAGRVMAQRAVMAQAAGPVYFTLENTKHDMAGVLLRSRGW